MASMDIFSSSVNPKSFKIHRNSSLANKLKATISEKLSQFLGDNYTDDVLAEYIVVLVCNGKHQNEAKNELEAFLGDKSGEFVSWLWDILLKTEQQSCIPNDLSNTKAAILRNAFDDAVDKGQRTSRPRIDSFMDAKDAKRLRLEKYGRKDEVIRKATMKHSSSRVKGSSEILGGGDQIMQSVDQCKIDNSSCLPRQLLQSTKREMVSRKLPSLRKENPQPRPIPVTKFAETRLSTNFASEQNARPRGNVWDRLGKPCDDKSIIRRSRIEVPSVDGTIRKLLVHDEGFVQHKPMPCVPVGKHIRRSIGEVPAHDSSMDIVIPDYRNEFTQVCGLSDVRSPHEENYCSRKRQFSEIDSGDASRSSSLASGSYKPFEVKEILEFNTSSSTQCSGSLGLKNVTAETRKSDGMGASCAFRSPDIAPNLKDENVSQPKLIREASVVTPQVLVSDSCPLVAMLESINNDNGGVHTSLKPVNPEILDPGLGLLQDELEVSKLCSKKIVMSNSDEVDSLANSGALSIPEEDNKSRTVFVTNVHFGAAKESLSSHFASCGLVVKVIMLTDPLTGRPKGSAYITFANKESIAKAVMLSGSSFWSRILTVVRKSEMPAMTVEPAQMPQKWFPKSNRMTTFQRPYSRPHLQWRRDQQVNTDYSISTRGDVGLVASQTAEQDAIDSDAQVLPHSLTYVRSTEVGST